MEEVSYTTYRNTMINITHTSTIDHFLSNERFYAFTKAGMIIHPDNMSGHLPIFCKFDMDQLNLNVESQHTSTPAHQNLAGVKHL